MVGIAPAHSYLELDSDIVRVRMGWAFGAELPRASIRDVRRVPDAISIGVHGRRGRWLVNGASGPLVALSIEPPASARVLAVPIRLRELIVSVDDPGAVIAALRWALRGDDDNPIAPSGTVAMIGTVSTLLTNVRRKTSCWMRSSQITQTAPARGAEIGQRRAIATVLSWRSCCASTIMRACRAVSCSSSPRSYSARSSCPAAPRAPRAPSARRPSAGPSRRPARTSAARRTALRRSIAGSATWG
jgi:hypothetical protein